MRSRDNVEDRLLVIFSLPSEDLECEGDTYCVQMGTWNSEIEAKVNFLKECELREEGHGQQATSAPPPPSQAVRRRSVAAPSTSAPATKPATTARSRQTSPVPVEVDRVSIASTA